MISIEQLQALLHKTKLVVTSVEADKIPVPGTENDFEDGYTLHLGEAIPEAKSSITIDGKSVVLKSVTQVQLIGKANIENFMNSTVEEDGKLVYEGSMKLDVSKPKFRRDLNGAMVQSVPPRVFLTEITFNKLAAGFRQSAAKQRTEMMSAFLAGGVDAVAANAISFAPKATPVDTLGEP